MFKLIIIDDELEQVEGITNLINWADYGITIAGTAYNGRDGLSLFNSIMPDIAIIDIQMPYMDGLTMIEQLRSMNITTQIIILTGYDNFEYTKRAIVSDVNDYILKPCSIDDIIKAVFKAKNKVIKNASIQEQLQRFHNISNKYASMFKDQLLNNLIENKLNSAESFFELAHKYNIKLLKVPAFVAVIQPNENNFSYNYNIEKELELYTVQLISYFEQKTFSCPFAFFVKNNAFVLIFSSDKATSAEQLQIVKLIYEQLTNSLDYLFDIGIGSIVSSPMEANKSYRQALAAIEYSNFLGGKSIILYEPFMSDNTVDFLYPFEKENEILDALDHNNQLLIKESINNFYNQIEENYKKDIHCLIRLTDILISSIFKFCIEKNMETTTLNLIIFETFSRIHSVKSLDLLKDNLNSALNKIASEMYSYKNSNKYVRYALDYIHDHYTKNITLQDLADSLYITPAYFSSLFKQEMKVNFISYLNTYRIKMAKELLKDITFKNYEIAYKVGFIDEKHFYKTFKKNTGLTPSQYRDSCR